MKPKVVVAEPIAPAGLAALSGECEVADLSGSSRSQLLDALGDAAGLVVRSATVVDEELIAAGPNLRVVGRAGVGVDNIDVGAATGRGVLVLNAPLANTVSAAEHSLALILSLARHIPQADARTKSGTWDRKSFTGVELSGKILGVVGLGRIGTLVAQRAAAFEMRVVSYDPFVGPERARRMGVEMMDLDSLLSVSDFVTIHLPLTAETDGLFGKDALARCKPGVRIINASRGGIVDELALAEALRSGQVSGAALDVFSTEPLSESPLFDMPGVVLTPHLGASTAEAQDKAGIQVAQAMVAALRGELVPSAVNVDLGAEVADEVQQFLPVAEQLGRVFIGLAGGVPDVIRVEARGRIGEVEVKPLGLAVLKGGLQAVSTDPVSFVNVRAQAEAKGINLVMESHEESPEYVSVMTVSGQVAGVDVSVSATMSRKGPVLVEILGHDVELPISRHLLILRNADVPGVIGRVGTFLGEAGVNIANMVVGRSRLTNDAAMMGLNLDQPMTESQVAHLRLMPGIEEARYVEVDNVRVDRPPFVQGQLVFPPSP
ncbi:MAG TPA: phosphoglycerate dehydrogenase [Acidimicrobiia bacterium]|nr:phosphoglycerate dehydrogenase [Acidimicrobiia bacterium]